LCREIRRSDPNTPVIFLSAAAYRQDHDEAMAAGANTYLNKPDGVLRLEMILTGVFGQAEARSLHARAAELVAMREEIDAHLVAVDVAKRKNNERAKRAFDHLLRAQAYSCFIASGGVGSHFERLWPDVVDDLVKGLP